MTYPIYPEVTIIDNGNTLSLRTSLKILRDDKYYALNMGADLKDEKELSLSKKIDFIKSFYTQAYVNLICYKINTEIKLPDRTPLFEGVDQEPEEERLKRIYNL